MNLFMVYARRSGSSSLPGEAAGDEVVAIHVKVRECAAVGVQAVADGHVVGVPATYWDIYSAVSSNNSPTPSIGLWQMVMLWGSLQYTGIYILLLVLIIPPPLPSGCGRWSCCAGPFNILGYIFCC